MDITIIEPTQTTPTPYIHSVSMVIRSFKGRRNVEVHLFRGAWDPDHESSEDWDSILASSDKNDPSRRMVMETFTTQERDRIVNYLKEQYSTRLTAIRSTPLTFPVPAGLPCLSSLEPGKDSGFIDFTRIPSYTLDIPMRGLYDLSRHKPLVDE